MPLTENQIESFEKNGFVVVDDVVPDQTLCAIETAYADFLEQRASALHQQHQLTSTFASLSFAERFARVVAECPDCVDDFNISLPLINGHVDPDTYDAYLPDALFHLQRDPHILDLVESLIGSEIASSPVQQRRIKPPQSKIGAANVAHSNVGVTTWHQDTVAVLPEAVNTRQVTVWVAVTDADRENGCLVSIPGSHQ